MTRYYCKYLGTQRLLLGTSRDQHEPESFGANQPSFRSTNSNPQDFIPHLRYLSRSERTSTALEVRARRDSWLGSMLDNVRSSEKISVGDRKPIAKMLLEDDTEGLTQGKPQVDRSSKSKFCVLI